MSKVKAEILGGVNIGGTVYVPGSEDALSKVITQSQIDHLTDQGAIVGDWKAGAKEEPAKEAEKDAAKEADKDPKK